MGSLLVWSLMVFLVFLGSPPTLSAFESWVVRLRGEVPGECRLLEAVRVSLRSNPSSLEYGELTGEVDHSEWKIDSSKRRTRDETRTKANIALKWDSDKIYWDYDISTSTSLRPGPPPDQVHGTIIRVGQRVTRYVPDAKYVRIADGLQQNPIPRELEIDPRELGFVQPFDWRDLLGATPGRLAERIARYEVLRREDNSVIIRCHTQTGHVATIVCSLQFGGNIIEYESIPSKGAGWKGFFRWKHNSEGICVLREHEHTQFFDGRVSEPYRRLNVKISEFSKRKPAQSQFAFDALGVAQNTRIEDLTTGKTYNYSPTGVQGVSSDDLERSIETIRSKGFGTKK